MFGLSKVTLLSILLESILFGTFTSLFAATIYILIVRRKKEKLNIRIMAVSIAMYVLALVHLAINMARLVDGFVNSPNQTGGTDAYFSSVSNSLYVSADAVYVAQTILGDAFVTYRLYIVWGTQKVMLVPAIVLLLIDLAAGLGSVISLTRVPPDGAPVFAIALKRWVTTFFSMTLVINFSCTILIAFRIWWVERRASSVSLFRSQSLSPAMVIVIESGAIYSATLVTLLGTYLSGSYSQYIVFEMLTQLIGIVFTLIIMRIGLGKASLVTTHPSTSPRQLPSNARVHRGGAQHLAVQLTHIRTAEDDQGEPIDLSLSDGTSSGTGRAHDSKDDKLRCHDEGTDVY